MEPCDEKTVDSAEAGLCREEVPYISIATPAYNEEESIEVVVRHWVACIEDLNITAEIVVANDGSTDRTGEILRGLQQEFSFLRVVGGEDNVGYGGALSNAISACSGEYVVTIDSDGQFDLADIAPFLTIVSEDDVDAVFGRRTGKKDSIPRVLADRCLNLIVRTLFGTRLRDTNCALKMIRRSLLQSLPLESTGFPFPTEVCVRVERSGAKCAEAPVGHSERQAGESKLKVWKTGTRMFWYLVYLKFQLILANRKIIRLQSGV